MATEEEQIYLREENQALRERASLQQETIDVQQTVIDQQQRLIEGLQQQTERLSGQVQELQERLKKDSHNSHLPPSSDRFGRQPRSLRKKSGKQAGGQAGHPGSTLHLSETPDEVIVHAVERCARCQQDLREVPSQQTERRQVVDLPPKRLVITAHQAEAKVRPVCQQVTQ